MNIKIDSENGVPIYLQVVKQVKHLVAWGALKSGDRLPPVRDLAMQLRINPNTVAKAYRELRYEKVINGRWGDGSFISQDVARIAESEKKRMIAEAVDKAIHQGTNLGFSKEDLSKLFSDRLQGIGAKGQKK